MVIKKELCLFVCLCKDFINTYIPITSVVRILSLQTYLHPCQLPFVATGELYIYMYIYIKVGQHFFHFLQPPLPLEKNDHLSIHSSSKIDGHFPL